MRKPKKKELYLKVEQLRSDLKTTFYYVKMLYGEDFKKWPPILQSMVRKHFPDKIQLNF